MSVWTSTVTGLTCHGCVTTVTEQLTGLDGVTSVDISLVEGGVSTITLDADRDLTDAEVEEALVAGGAFALAR